MEIEQEYQVWRHYSSTPYLAIVSSTGMKKLSKHLEVFRYSENNGFSSTVESSDFFYRYTRLINFKNIDEAKRFAENYASDLNPDAYLQNCINEQEIKIEEFETGQTVNNWAINNVTPITNHEPTIKVKCSKCGYEETHVWSSLLKCVSCIECRFVKEEKLRRRNRGYTRWLRKKLK